MGKKSKAKAERKKVESLSSTPQAVRQKPEDLIGKPFALRLSVQSMEQIGRANLPGELGRKLIARFLDIECDHKTTIPTITAHFVLEPDMANWNTPAKPEPPPLRSIKEGEEGKVAKDVKNAPGK